MSKENVEINIPNNRVKVHNVIFRIPTLIFTVLMVMTLGIYFLVSVSMGSKLDVPNFLLLGTMEIVTYYLYFPDGQLKGQNDTRYINNKQTYNTKASKVNAKRQIKNLQEYCIVEYKDRIKEYIETELGYCDLDWDDYLYMKENLKPTDFYIKSEITINGRSLYLDKAKYKRLTNLLFKDMPVRANNSRTILSAVESNSVSAIRDKSKKDKTLTQIRMVFKVISIALFSGYMLITNKDGISLTTIAMFLMDIFAIVTIAVTYVQGENNQKIHKANFYMDLSIFIDNFYEWLLYAKNINIDTYTPELYISKKGIKKEEQDEQQEILSNTN